VFGFVAGNFDEALCEFDADGLRAIEDSSMQ
jgi:hypothetical protein